MVAISIGGFVVEFLTDSIKARVKDPETQAMMLRTLGGVESAVEELCPLVMKVNERTKEVEVAYGPQTDFKWIVLFATTKVAIVVGFDEWWDDMDLPPEVVSDATIWAEIFEAVNNHEGRLATILLTGRLLRSDGVKDVQKQAAEITARDMTPLVVVMCAVEGNTSCGGATIVSLPKMIGEQISDAERTLH